MSWNSENQLLRRNLRNSEYRSRLSQFAKFTRPNAQNTDESILLIEFSRADERLHLRNEKYPIHDDAYKGNSRGALKNNRKLSRDIVRINMNVFDVAKIFETSGEEMFKNRMVWNERKHRVIEFTWMFTIGSCLADGRMSESAESA